MTTSLVAPAAQICVFALGCALIHAARAHAALLTRLLVGAAILLAVAVLLAGSFACASDDVPGDDGITVYRAL